MCNHLLVMGPDPGSRQPWLTAKVEFQYVCIRILQYCVKVQYNVHTSYG